MLALEVPLRCVHAFEERLTLGIQKNVPGPMLFWTMLLWCLAWAFVPLESRVWKGIRANAGCYYPHINFLGLRPLDPVRVALQSVFLVLYNAGGHGGPSAPKRIAGALGRFFAGSRERGILGKIVGFMQSATNRYTSGVSRVAGDRVLLPVRYRFLVIGLLAVATIALLTICITQPLDIKNQTIFLVAVWMLAVVLKQIRSHFTLLALFVISIMVSSRYLWWRYAQTLNLDTPVGAVSSLLLVLAETYAFIVMVLGYFQVCWVLDRKPYPLPEDRNLWPHVDIFIPTYNEPLDVVRPTVFGATGMDWPRDKLHVYILDDGSREEFAQFAAEVGVGYIKRKEHNHAKAGNINHAMTVTRGEFIAIFDCDHVPTRSFLQMTMGWFVHDSKIALVQTPHHFYSPDPFERNLKLDHSAPIENALFHDYIQKGNDTWNATMFCGSCAVMRRCALEEVGGIAVETVTEDAHTSLRLNRKGWSSAFLGMPLAAGLSTETLSAHIGQRIRWARGMVQIFRLDNPLRGKGLSIGQRLCFLNAMIHFLHGLPRIIFLLAPVPYMLFGEYVIYASAAAIFVFVLPHMVHSLMTTQIIQKGYRYPFLSSVYEAVLSWYILLPTTVALIMPHKGKFNVTAKGGMIAREFLDWSVTKPYLVLIVLLVGSLFVGTIRMLMYPYPEYGAILVNVLWILYNLIVLGATMAVAVESVQARKYPRVLVTVPVFLSLESGHQVKATMTDYSQNGASVRVEGLGAGRFFSMMQRLSVVISYNGVMHAFPAIVRHVGKDGSLGLELTDLTLAREREFTECTFCRSDTWTLRAKRTKDPGLLAGFFTLCRLGIHGYRSMIEFAPEQIRFVYRAVANGLEWIVSFIPRIPSRDVRMAS
ncbi:MAG TPA: UDP-forming cellulose synthase catalytic subunit [Sutterella sp.]|nr:UDP-forming cellulose synthase catalytic subunit [Sutterella sp.]